ncbi:MarR family transcriptional regulator [Paenibacillus filicis]|uniref:MarR family transcriptional regulator n=1 Tax=Paenibacillus gyeongsangnamensis TaxID=3388067 RepID=A0ABT4QDI9_9BACL|nr:MarR family transcriptional regulator [Paenibacillus filicis]MCZ8514943.1 MarR family transcriptional regulator [Paenibacillus filicis]
MIDQKYTIPRWMSLIYRCGQMYIGERLKNYEIGKGQHIFLNALYKEDGLSQEELSSYLRIDKGTTAKALKKLEALGYVTRQVRDEDRRSYRVFLTDKALGIKDQVRGVLMDWRHILTYGFTEEEKESALQLLERMGSNVTRFIEDGTAQDLTKD